MFHAGILELPLLTWALLICVASLPVLPEILGAVIAVFFCFMNRFEESRKVWPPSRVPRLIMPLTALGMNFFFLVDVAIGIHDGIVGLIAESLPGHLAVHLIYSVFVFAALLLMAALLLDVLWFTSWLNRVSERWLERRYASKPAFWDKLSRGRHFYHEVRFHKRTVALLARCRWLWQWTLGAVPAYVSRRVSPDRVEVFIRRKLDAVDVELSSRLRSWRGAYMRTPVAPEDKTRRAVSESLDHQGLALTRLTDQVFCSIQDCPSHDSDGGRLWEVVLFIDRHIQSVRRVQAIVEDLALQPQITGLSGKLRVGYAFLSKSNWSTREVTEVIQLRLKCQHGLPGLRNRLAYRDEVVEWLAKNSESPHVSFLMDGLITEYIAARDWSGLIAVAKRLPVSLGAAQHADVAEAYYHYSADIGPQGSGDLFLWALELARGHAYQARDGNLLNTIGVVAHEGVNR